MQIESKEVGYLSIEYMSKHKEIMIKSCINKKIIKNNLQGYDSIPKKLVPLDLSQT